MSTQKIQNSEVFGDPKVVNHVSRLLRLSCKTLLRETSDAHVDSEISKLKSMLPEQFGWSLSTPSVRDFLLHKLGFELPLNSYVGVFESIENGRDLQDFAGVSFDDLAQDFLLRIGRVEIGIHLDSIDLHPDFHKTSSIAIAQNFRIAIGDLKMSGLAINPGRRACSLFVGLDAFSTPNSKAVLARAADELRKIIALLWISGCCHFGGPKANFRRSPQQAPQIVFPGKPAVEALGIEYLDPTMVSLSSSCGLILPDGPKSLEIMDLAWSRYCCADESLRYQLDKSFHFLTASLSSHTPEDRIVSLCIAFECLLGWNLGEPKANNRGGQAGPSSTPVKNEYDNKFAKSRMIDRAVFLLGGSKESRENVAASVSRLHANRSVLVHGGATRIDRLEAKGLFDDASKVLKRCIWELLSRFCG